MQPMYEVKKNKKGIYQIEVVKSLSHVPAFMRPTEEQKKLKPLLPRSVRKQMLFEVAVGVVALALYGVAMYDVAVRFCY